LVGGKPIFYFLLLLHFEKAAASKTLNDSVTVATAPSQKLTQLHTIVTSI
jgi:hypothetical protein